jgi:hypothetical protein
MDACWCGSGVGSSRRLVWGCLGRLMLAGFVFGRSVHKSADAITHACADVAENGGAQGAWVRGHVENRVVFVNDLGDAVEQSGGRVGGDWGGLPFDRCEHSRFGDYLSHVGGLPVVDLVITVSLRGACVHGEGRLGLDAMDAASGAHEAVRADGAAVADVEQEVANHPTMVVEEDAVASGFVSLAALLLMTGVLLPVQAVKAVGVEGVDLHDEDAEVVLGKEVVIIPDSVGRGLVVSVLLLGAKAGLPLVASLGRRSAANEVGAIALLVACALAATGFRGAEVRVLCS